MAAYQHRAISANKHPGNGSPKSKSRSSYQRANRLVGLNDTPLAIPTALIRQRGERMIAVICSLPEYRDREDVLASYERFRELYYGETPEQAKENAHVAVYSHMQLLRDPAMGPGKES